MTRHASASRSAPGTAASVHWGLPRSAARAGDARRQVQYRWPLFGVAASAPPQCPQARRPRQPAAAVYRRAALSHLVQAVEAYLAGEALADVLHPPMAAAYSALADGDDHD
jgi:hypothetical protein